MVLSRDLYASATSDIDERLVLGRLAARYPECYTFACAGLAGATPELLIKRQGRQVSSLVLAGTAPRGQDRRRTGRSAPDCSPAKETEEHEYAAASVRDSLAPLCDQLTVAEHPVLLKFANLQHLATTVHGTLSARTPAARAIPCSRC